MTPPLLLSLVAYERISALHSHIVASHHPNVTAVAKHLADGNTTNEQMLLKYAKKLHETSLRLAATSSDPSSLSAFPCFDSEAIEGMKSELPTCLAAAEGVAQQFDPCEWWKYQCRHTNVGKIVPKNSPYSTILCSSREGIFTSPKFIRKTARTVIRRLHSTICDDAVQL